MIIDEIGGDEFTYTGVWNIMRREAKDGIQGLYRGFTASVIGIGVYRATSFAVFASLQPVLPSELSSFQCFLYHMFIQVVAGFVSYPLDTVRRRQVIERKSFLEILR